MGAGKSVFANGDVFEGEFDRDSIGGFGKAKYRATQNIYIGGWRGSRRHGKGVLKLRSGTTVDGMFRSGYINGIAIVDNVINGSYFRGCFKGSFSPL